MLAGLRAGRVRVAVELTTADLHVALHGPGVPEGLLVGLMVEGYSLVHATGAAAVLVRRGGAPADVHVKTLRGRLLGQPVVFRLLEQIHRGPSLVGRVVRCRVVGRSKSSEGLQASLLATVVPRAEVHAFMMGRHARVGRGSLVQLLPAELVAAVAAQVWRARCVQ